MSDPEAARPQSSPARDIAIIGMAGRFPGAASVEQFWANLVGGVESIRALTEEELRAAGVPGSALRDPSYVRACPVLEGIDQFDAGFYGMSPRDASVMDPAQRFFLEVAWTAFENAACAALPEDGRVGVFAASGEPLYYTKNLRRNPEIMRSMGEFLVRHTGNDMNFLATRASYEYDLRGPSVNLQTACSSALVAVHLARQSLIARECDIALVGGSTVVVPMGHGYHYKEGEILSPDGHCRPFDEASAGTVFGSGTGCLVLKRLSDALDNGDNVLAVVKGSAINNDGALKVGFLAPGVEGQVGVIREALEDAGLSAEAISYVEAHGTGTAVGDPIELTALQQAFGRYTDKKGFCAIGSVKSNIGHLGEAAAAASLIKVVLSLQHRTLPKSLGYERPNPRFDFESSAFFVNAETRQWSSDGPRRAGITALGAGGTNCHVILEEAPPPLASEGGRVRQLITLSAKSKGALERRATDLATFLKRNPDVDLADLAYTTNVGRRPFNHRRTLCVQGREEAIALLEGQDPQRIAQNVAEGSDRSVAFTFPGGGAQYARMGIDLYEQEPVFRAEMDACFAVIRSVLGRDLKETLYCPVDRMAAATEELRRPSLSLPALFATEYALAKLYQSWGVTCAAAIGHSMGEYTAACLAGVFSLEDALRLVMFRGRLFEMVPKGGMLGVPLSEERTRSLMPEGLGIAAVNAPELCVASGPVALLDELERLLKARDIESTRIHIDVAAHSTMLDPILEEFRRFCQTIRYNPPTLPLASNLTGGWLSASEATDPEYWVQHLRNTVRFADCVETVLRDGERAFLEIGPGRTLTTLVGAQATRVRAAVNSMRHPQEQASDTDYSLRSLGKLWTFGVALDWTLFYQDQLRNRIPLPEYPFEHRSFWIEPEHETESHARSDLRRRDDIDTWFYGPAWAPAPRQGRTAPGTGYWLVFMDDWGLGEKLSAKLDGRVVRVRRGATFKRTREHEWQVEPGAIASFQKLLEALEENDLHVDRIVYLWTLDHAPGGLLAWPTRARPSQLDPQRFERDFSSLFELGKAVGSVLEKAELTLVTNRAFPSGSNATADPQKVLALGPLQVLPREFPELKTRLIDLPDEAVPKWAFGAGSWVERGARLAPQVAQRLDSWAQELSLELMSAIVDQIVLLRSGNRAVRRWLPMPMPAAAEPAVWVRTDAVVLVTGGLGGIGLEVAAHIARRPGVKIALLSRTGLPDEAEWDLIVEQSRDLALVDKIRRVRALRAAGAEVMVAVGDVTQRVSLAAALETVRSAWGPVTGVIHSAGVMDDEPILTRTHEAMARVLAPKVEGTVHLDALLTEPLDFFVAFSSVASLLGLPGQVDYTAANAFVDAFMLERSQRAPGRSLVVNWNAWRDVGMVEKFLERGVAAEPVPAHPSRHPALDGYDDAGVERAFVASLSVERTWMLAEHRIRGALPLIPGTGLLELARAAFAEGRANASAELENVTFIAPLQVAPGTSRRMTVRLRRTGADFEISLVSRGDDGPETLHLTAGARELREQEPARLDLDALTRRCSEQVLVPERGFLDQEFVDFGPRWGNILSIGFGNAEARVHCRLPREFAADLGGYALHPAVLDMATGAAQALIPGFDAAKHFYVPLAYERVRVFRPMPAEIISHVRCLPSSGNGLAYFDVTVSDTQGNCCVEVRRFTMKRVAAEDAIVATEAAPASVGPMSGAVSRQDQALVELLREAITPAEGIAALDRALAQREVSQVVISSIDVNDWRWKLDHESAASSAAADDGAPVFSRPELSSEYEAPTGAVEEAISQTWSRLLGVENVGALDDFFELGGNSLIAVRLFARIKKDFGVSLPISTLFQAPTVRSLASFLATRGIVETPGQGARSAPFTSYRNALDASSAPVSESKLVRSATPEEWAYRVAFRAVAAPSPPEQPQRGKVWLVFLDDTGVGASLCARLKERGDTVVRVREGDAYHRSSETEYSLVPEQGRAGYDRLFAELEERGYWPSEIVHLWTLTVDETFRPGSSFFHRIQERGFYSLLFLVQAFGERNPAGPLSLSFVSNGVHRVRDEGLLYASKATAWGALGSIVAEFPGYRARCIDLELPTVASSSGGLLGRPRDAVDDPFDRLAAVVELELAGTCRQETVAYRRGARYVREVERLAFARATFDEGRLVADGTYLVTVGDDHVGERIARTLFERTQCRVLLVGARTTPAIEALTSRSSGRVVFAAADVTNLDQMRTVLEASPRRAIRGVFHAASHRDERPLLVKTQSSVDDVLAPRIQGTRVLDALFEGRAPDFIALCASLETAIEPMLRFDACAAAAFCDAQAMAQAGAANGHVPTVVLSLELAAGESNDPWSTFSDDEFAEALSAALGRGAPRCLALGPVAPGAVAVERELAWRRRALSVPPLGDDVAAPKSESLEQALLTACRKALRAERLEPSESLRGRGMSELDLAWVLAHVRTSYGLEPTLTELCEPDSVAEIVGVVQARAARRQGTQTSTFKHLVAMHNGNPEGRTPFFLVAGMFGNILNLRHLGHLLGADRQSFGIQARGLYGEAQPHMTIHEMAEAYLEELRRLQPHGPYALGGFSGGGLTALEMAQRLRAEGEQIGLLVMLDTPLPVQEPLTARDRAMIQLISLQQKGPRYFTEWAESRVKWEISKVQKRFRKIDEEYSPEQYKSDAVGAAFQAAVSAYRVEHYPGTLTLFRPKLDKAYHVGPNRFLTRERSVVLEDNGWSEHVARVDVIEVPGDHDSMVLEPGVRVLAANLKELLERVDRMRAAEPQAASPRPVESSQRVELGQ